VVKKVKEGNLYQVSIDRLFEGMSVVEDIYNADATTLIIRRGRIINSNDIEKIKSLNAGKDNIYVSGGTFKAMTNESPPVDVVSISEIEEATGYAAAKDETFVLLDEIATNKTVKQEALLSVSAELSNRLEVTSPSVILSLINALAPVDEYLQRHCVNVSLLNGLIGQWLGLEKKEIDKLVLVGLLHDCGKALVPSQVLTVPRKLTIIEFEVIKMHSVYSYDLLTDFPQSVRQGARYHHEKVNGKGYPNHLTNEDIPWEARITAISDIYDAMVSQRAYKDPRSPFSIMAMLSRLRDSEVDGRLVDVFIKSMPEELMDKPVVMSDGSTGVLRSYDPDDIEYPMIEVGGRIIKSDEQYHCIAMLNRD